MIFWQQIFQRRHSQAYLTPIRCLQAGLASSFLWLAGFAFWQWKECLLHNSLGFDRFVIASYPVCLFLRRVEFFHNLSG
jgi:hypothetical protein